MKPLIKWAGGKSGEIKYIEKMIPDFDRYVEPFFGGGALFFDLEPKKAIINDISEELTLLYSFLKTGKSRDIFYEEMYRYVESWEKINEYMKHFEKDFIKLYIIFREDKVSIGELKEELQHLFENKIMHFNGLFKKEFCIDQKDLLDEIKKRLLEKLRRTKEKVDVKKSFSEKEIMKNIETGFRTGFYMHFRNLMNVSIKDKKTISKEKRVANWYFIREFCYGGMFRFNKSGEFNVPYGGIGYNKKDFRAKADYLFSKDVHSLLDRTTIENKDFEEVLTKSNLTEKDFIFLDPPYDTEFSKYEDNAFTKEDQKRLAKTLINLPAKWILIIKETPFILDLYKDKKGVHISRFDKEYLFQIKDRVETQVKHLIIHNLDSSQVKQKKLI